MTSDKSLHDTLKMVFEHIKEVQSNIVELNHSSMSLLEDAIFDLEEDISEDGYIALQHQDILSQQLNATNELIEMVCRHIDKSSSEDLNRDIISSLEVAKAKKEAFSGNAFGEKHKDLSELF